MRVGIYFGHINPQIGGGNTILYTIKKAVEKKTQTNDYEFFFIYNGGKKNKEKSVSGGITYINIDKVMTPTRKVLRIVLENLRFKSAANHYRFDIIAQKYDIDIFWIAVPVKVDISYPFIYTVWDLGHRTVPCFPEVSRGYVWDGREANYSLMIPKASFVITGNETGKKEILENYCVNSNKIRIVPFPISSFCYGDQIKPEMDIPEQYFFYPAQFWAHKNHICILEAIKKLKYEDNLDIKVFFTGSDRGNKDYIIEKALEYGISDNIVVTGFLKDEEIKYLYTHATAMIYASLMGPNNLPPLEAAFLHCPVIITDLEGHREQLGDCAMYFNGYDSSDLAEKMKSILDGSVRDELIHRETIFSCEYAKNDYFLSVMEILEEFKQIQHTWK